MQTRICEKKQITIHYISYYRDLEFRHFWKPFIKIVHEGIQLNTEIDYITVYSSLIEFKKM